MPELDGFELAAMIRQHPRCRRTAILFVSAVHLTDLDRVQGLCGGRGGLRVGARRARDPAREDRRLRRPLPQDDRARAPQPHARGARARRAPASSRPPSRSCASASTACACRARRSPKPTGARPSSWRCSRTSCAIRCSRSAPRSSSCARRRRRPTSSHWSREVVDRQVNQLVRLVDDLLDASRISSGKLELRRESSTSCRSSPAPSSRAARSPSASSSSVDASASVRARLRRRRRRAPHAGVPEPAQQRRQVQPERRAHLARASDARDGESSRACATKAWALRRTDLPRVFEMFYQGSAKPDDAQGGLGLGLALVHQLVGLHGGHRRSAQRRSRHGAASSWCGCRRVARVRVAATVRGDPRRRDARAIAGASSSSTTTATRPRRSP